MDRQTLRSLPKLVAVAALAATAAPALASDSSDVVQEHAANLFISVTPEADFGSSRTLSARTQGIEWQAPAWSLGETSVSVGARYAYTRFEYSGIASRNRDLHQLQIPIALQGGAGEWQWRATATPGFATSSNVVKNPLNRATSEDVFATAEFIASHRTASGTLALGVAHDRRFGRSLSYPMLAWRGRTDQLDWQLGAPDAWIDYRPRAGTVLSAAAGPAGMQWHAVRDDFESDFDYRVRRWDIRFDVTQDITDNLSLSLHAGRAFDRRHRFEADAPELLDLSADDAWFFGIRFGYGNHRRADGYARSW